jgi:hypothetical protein
VAIVAFLAPGHSPVLSGHDPGDLTTYSILGADYGSAAVGARPVDGGVDRIPRALLEAGARVIPMTSKPRFTVDEARSAGERIGIDWNTSRFDVEQFRMGMDVELEHGTDDPETNVTDDDPAVTAKIARAHLSEFPDYYTRLGVMEADAEAYWEAEDA